MMSHYDSKLEDKENEDIFNKIWSWYRTGANLTDESDIDKIKLKTEEADESINWDHWYNGSFAPSSLKRIQNNNSFNSATYDTSNSIQHIAPWFGNDDPPGRDTLLLKCREAIESLQEEIEEQQRSINERDYLLNQAQEREEQLSHLKNGAMEEITLLREKLSKIREEMRENEERYEKEWHKILEDNK